ADHPRQLHRQRTRWSAAAALLSQRFDCGELRRTKHIGCRLRHRSRQCCHPAGEWQLGSHTRIDRFRGPAKAPAPKPQHLFAQRLDPVRVLQEELLQLLRIVRQLRVVERHNCIVREHASARGISLMLVRMLEHYTTCNGSFHVRSGLLQSMPSSSIDSCAGVRCTEPEVARGHTKRPRSSRLAKRHSPSPSAHSTLIRSPRLPRNTNTWPEYALFESAVSTS